MLTFVNQINKRSENAHNNKAGMETIGTFDFNDNHYFLMAIRTDRRTYLAEKGRCTAIEDGVLNEQNAGASGT